MRLYWQYIRNIICFSLTMTGVFICYLYFHQDTIKRRPMALLSPKGLCKGNNNLSLVIFVASKITHNQKRQAVRASWAKDLLDFPHVQLVFFVGRDSSKSLEKNIRKEAELYQDIIQDDFVDSINNLTVKSMKMLTWFYHNCRQNMLPNFFKTSDDVYINLPNLVDLMQKNNNSSQKIMIGMKAGNLFPVREPNEPWYVPYNIYPRETFPQYLLGSAYFMSGTSAVAIYEASLNTKLFPIEDVYITGILAEKAGIQLLSEKKFSSSKRNILDTCQYRKSISSQDLSISELRYVYERMKDPEIKCLE